MQPIRLDTWAAVADAPTSVPFELAPKGIVFRGMNDLAQAIAYADLVRAFFRQNGADQAVYVVRGPTTTTGKPYEVVDASCGYTILHRAVLSHC